MRRILDAKYEKAELNKVTTKQCQHLNTKERKILLRILRKFKDMFDVKLGKWNTSLVDLELKDDENPVYLRPYSVPRVHAAMFRK